MDNQRDPPRSLAINHVKTVRSLGLVRDAVPQLAGKDPADGIPDAPAGARPWRPSAPVVGLLKGDGRDNQCRDAGRS
jgi:hypothetical protein